MPTCGRTPHLARSLGSLSGLDYSNYEIVVVDNAPHVAGTARLVREHAARDARVRYAAEPRAGVTHARNRGLAEARGEIVAYVDDDVTVDPGWLRALAGGFADAGVAAVTGDVLASELETPAQVWIEQYGGFGKGCRRRRFDRAGVETAGAAGWPPRPARSTRTCRVPTAPARTWPSAPRSCAGSAGSTRGSARAARSVRARTSTCSCAPC
ncbi:glycosyltransferase [Catellatospora bangladeshensis]|uniref:glycosyltransferase n=1 Tax=Catellatospora bangladeshensis TaxID=310355 RepID=UPI00361148CD